EGQRPDDAEVARYQAAVASELQAWGWIEEVEVSDPTWIEVAYTWSWPEGRWAASALERLERGGVWQAGRYGRWVFQGIAASIREGAFIGTSFRDGA
nr:protoporphyrinogen oxidase-like protein [Myxococcota bacterium]